MSATQGSHHCLLLQCSLLKHGGNAHQPRWLTLHQVQCEGLSGDRKWDQRPHPKGEGLPNYSELSDWLSFRLLYKHLGITEGGNSLICPLKSASFYMCIEAYMHRQCRLNSVRLSVPCFSHLQNGNNSHAYLTWLLRGLMS